MPRLISFNEKKKDLPDHFVKTPLLFFNDDYLALVRLQGRHEHHHHDRDELFIVLDGKLKLEVEGEMFILEPGQAILVQSGEDHLSMSDEPTHVLMIEPQSIRNIYTK